MPSRIARICTVLGLALLLVGLTVVLSSSAATEVGRYILARTAGIYGVSLGAVLLIGAFAHGVYRLFRDGRTAGGTLAAVAWTILTVNVLFWGLVAVRIEPLQQLYERGRIVWIGEKAFLFGHGYWEISDGYWEHQTLVKLSGGGMYRGPTLALLQQLRQRGAATVWGSWCFTGNYPYIRKDLVSGRREPWPSYASYNTAPGVTIPIWVGSTFVRLAWPENRYASEPQPIGSFEPDTLLLLDPSAHHIQQAFGLVQQRTTSPLPRPDSVSWHPMHPDTVYGLPWTVLEGLSARDAEDVRLAERRSIEEKTKTGLALFWIRGRAFPMYVRIPPRFRRPADSQDIDTVMSTTIGSRRSMPE